MSLTWLGTAFRRAREAFFSERLEAERDDEMAFHLEMEIEKNVRRGMTADEARRAAVIAFGGRDRFREEVREARGFAVIDDLWRDVRIAWRRIGRAPAFAAGVIATLGIGIGATVGIGGIVHRVLLSELPYLHADRLVRVSFATPGNSIAGDLHPTATYVHLATSKSFEGFAAYSTRDHVTITDHNQPIQVRAGFVTPGIFALLGVQPVLGSFFAPSDTNWTSDNGSPLLISETLWEQRYGRDPDIIGKVIPISLGERRVIGVLPRSFDFPEADVRIWYPSAVYLSRASLDSRGYNVIARVKPNVSLAAATASLNAMLPSISARFPQITPSAFKAAQPRVTLTPLREWTVAGIRSHMLLLGATVAIVLLIATTNVVNLFLLRTERAAQETAVARSLGASPGRLAQRFVSEGVVLGFVAGIPAMLVAGGILGSRLGFAPAEIPRINEVGFGFPAIAAAMTGAIVIGALVGLTAFAAAAADNGAPADRLRGAARATATPAWRRARQILVTTQIAFAVVLLVSAALLTRSFDNLRRGDLGFDPAQRLTFEVAIPYGPGGYGPANDKSVFHARVLDGLRSLPGMNSATVGITSKVPLASSGTAQAPLVVERADGGAPHTMSGFGSIATPEYFRAMGIPLLAGRTFQAGDIRRAAPAVILSASVSERVFGGENPIGRRIRRTDGSPRVAEFEVVGVVGDVPGDRIEDGAAAVMYFPLLRDIDGMAEDSYELPVGARIVQYVVHAATLPSAEAIRGALQQVDPRVPAMNFRPLVSYVDAAMARVRLTMLLLGVASGGALLLGVIGVYSVVAYAAAGRAREFGVRLALGATPRGIASIVLRDGVVLAVMGVVAGTLVAALGTRILRSLLYGVSATSVTEFVAALGVVISVTLVATMIPARRASRTDAAVVLRGE